MTSMAFPMIYPRTKNHHQLKSHPPRLRHPLTLPLISTSSLSLHLIHYKFPHRTLPFNYLPLTRTPLYLQHLIRQRGVHKFYLSLPLYLSKDLLNLSIKSPPLLLPLESPALPVLLLHAMLCAPLALFALAPENPLGSIANLPLENLSLTTRHATYEPPNANASTART